MERDIPPLEPTLVIDRIGRLITCESDPSNPTSLGVIEDAAVVIRGDRIAARGYHRDLVREQNWPADTPVIDAGGRVVLPGLVDCHTHLCFAGDRRQEYQERITGVPYQAIAERGGGILSTVRRTREALKEHPEDLAGQLKDRLDRMLACGTTTAEVKSGYGLSTEAELAILRLYQQLNRTHALDLIPTFLGAHEVPPEFRGTGPAGRARYLDLVCSETLPAVASEQLALFCDVFCETGVFTVDESRRLLRRGVELGMGAKLHSDQFSSLGGTRLAAELGAVSVDHLHVTSPDDAEALAKGGVVAVGLPGVTYFLGLRDATPWSALHRAGVPIALATDLNPGTCMTENLQAIASIASSRWRMPDYLILRGLTIEAAKALGRESQIGTVSVGKQADLVILDCHHEGEITYHFGINHVDMVIKAGRPVVTRGQHV